MPNETTRKNRSKSWLRRLTSGSVNNLAFFNLMGPVLLNVINFLTLPIITRALGPTNYGMASLYLSWGQFFTAFVGLQTAGTIATSMVYYRPEEQIHYLSSVLTLSLVGLGGTLIVLLLGMPFFLRWIGFTPLLLLLLLAYAFGTFVLNFANIYFTYQKKAYINFAINLFLCVTQVGLALTFIFTRLFQTQNSLSLIVSYIIPYTLLGAALLAFFFLKGRTGYRRNYWAFCIPLCLPLIFHSLSQIILAHTSKYLLQRQLSYTEAGIYALAITLGNVLNILYNALNNTWVPFYYDDLKSGDLFKIRVRAKSYLWLFAILCAGFVLVGPEVISILADKSFATAREVLPYLTPGQFFIFLYSFAVNYEFFYRKTMPIAVGTTVAAALNILLNFLLIPLFGIFGAALATSIAYLFLWIFHEWIARQRIEAMFPVQVRDYLPALGLVLMSCLYSSLLMQHALLRWALASVLGIILLARTWKKRTLF